jgi:cyanophycin synthetase
MGGRSAPVEVEEVRVLDGPNLYFTRPAIKLTLRVPGWTGGPERRVNAAAARLGVPGVGPDPETSRFGPGPSGTERRTRFVARVAAHLTRELADAAGTRLAVRTRPGPGLDHVMVAFPWRRRGAAGAFAGEVGRALGEALTTRRGFARLAAEAGARMADVPPGPGPSVPDPEVPVIAVTGTNGKTTTVRLLAHIGRTAGLRVAYSSTDGVFVNGDTVMRGDYSGFGGAALSLEAPGVQLAVLETARGGMLLRGVGTMHNDVAVVTNVTADHLGLLGVDTLDELAEVKAIPTRITRPEGWDVLNADDPRVLAMRRVARGRPWLYSLDPDHPALREVMDEGGRAITRIDGWITVLGRRRDARSLVALQDVPMTLAGISSHYTSNALAGAAAALGVGIPEPAVVRGLRTFVLSAEANPGRTNLFDVGGRIVVVDYAHNEAGVAGLVETCRGLRPPGREIWLAMCSAGDRLQSIRRNMAYLAARGSDHFVVAQLLGYLRGNTPEGVLDGLRAGAADAGHPDVPVHVDEVSALRWMLDSARRGDIVAVTALAQRAEIFDLIREQGGRPIGPNRVRTLARRASGAA